MYEPVLALNNLEELRYYKLNQPTNQKKKKKKKKLLRLNN